MNDSSSDCSVGKFSFIRYLRLTQLQDRLFKNSFVVVIKASYSIKTYASFLLPSSTRETNRVFFFFFDRYREKY